MLFARLTTICVARKSAVLACRLAAMAAVAHRLEVAGVVVVRVAIVVIDVCLTLAAHQLPATRLLAGVEVTDQDRLAQLPP